MQRHFNCSNLRADDFQPRQQFDDPGKVKRVQEVRRTRAAKSSAISSRIANPNGLHGRGDH
jgi:hypothetical protein